MIVTVIQDGAAWIVNLVSFVQMELQSSQKIATLTIIIM